MANDPIVAQLRPDQIQEITTAFMEFDSNRNGIISSQEMRECLRRSNIQYQDGEVDRVISSMDFNRDGNVSYDEYMKFMARVYTGQLNDSQRGAPSQQGAPNPPYHQNQTST
jgi:Ca2+-binding EF-hand superfamily protein